ncbi:MAG: AraC family transcriptional regulator [Inhella sp.]
MILTAMPDLAPRPLTAANAAFRERFYRRWGRENALVCGQGRQFEYEAYQQTLSIKAAWGGGERYFFRERDVVVDDDHWLVVNEGRVYGSRVRSPRSVTSLALFFRPGLAAEVAAQRLRPLMAILESPEAAPAQAPEFSEHLRPHGARVSARLLALYRQAQAGERSEDWLEQQMLLLMDELLAAHPEPGAASARVLARQELLARLRRAADFIHSCHREPIGLDEMARVADLSRYHFVRHFRQEFGITPYACLLRKRAREAVRLFAAGESDSESVALQCGFANRFALRRAMLRWGLEERAISARR